MSRNHTCALLARASGVAFAMILLHASAASAQTVSPASSNPAASNDGVQADQVADTDEGGEIIVSASRIQRAGFDAPTPTTVLGELELSQGNRPNIGETLNDLPQFRATQTPATTAAGTSSGITTADLRGLGAVRTLTLLNGHRFVGAGDLNVVPQDLIKRVDVVTGGASAAWGSGAVAGVVNIILDDDLTGLRAGAMAGVSSRGDAAQYGANLAWGTKFASDRGHFVIAGSYLDNQGALSRNDRRFFGSDIFRGVLTRDVNSTQLYNGGSVLNPGTGQTLFAFNPNGTLAPFPYGSQTAGTSTVGGGAQALYDRVPVTAPYKRLNMFARASYELSDSLKIWAEGGFNRQRASYGILTEPAAVPIAPDNAFLSPTARAQITAAGVPAASPFLLVRLLDDIGGPNRFLGYRYTRRNLEGAIGLDGSFGDSWKYDLYYNHGELRDDGSLTNQRLVGRFNNAVDSVLVGGAPTCRINADANPANNDPACVPINLLGNGTITAQAAAYAFGNQRQIRTTKLDAAGGSLHGQPFSTWAGGVDIAVGADLRWEELETNYVDPLSATRAFSLVNASRLNGGFDVKEFFGEVNVPLLNLEDTAHLEVNGAARYSDYSTSGGIWTWKAGSTLRLFNDLLLRGVYSRDIRSPTIDEFFTPGGSSIQSVTDPYTGVSGPVIILNGGNPSLTPEISHTLTLGASYSPRFARGLRISVDYYDIDIDNVIAALGAQDTLSNCFARLPGDNSCGGVITRTGPNTTLTGTFRNLANYHTRGLDIEASYVMPLSEISGGAGGNLRFRVFANHVMKLLINDGTRITDRAGIVGDTTQFSTPEWRATASAGYESDSFSGTVRVRHLGGGRFADTAAIANNRIDGRTYVDLDLRYNVGPFTLFGSVTNLFDVNPQFVTVTSPIYDVIGTYASAGVKLKF
jgi:iron complex outermembrane receptor protein